MSDLNILNWKSSYDVMLLMCKVVNNISRNFNLCDFYMQEYIFMFSSALEWR